MFFEKSTFLKKIDFFLKIDFFEKIDIFWKIDFFWKKSIFFEKSTFLVKNRLNNPLFGLLCLLNSPKVRFDPQKWLSRSFWVVSTHLRPFLGDSIPITGGPPRKSRWQKSAKTGQNPGFDTFWNPWKSTQKMTTFWPDLELEMEFSNIKKNPFLILLKVDLPLLEPILGQMGARKIRSNTTFLTPLTRASHFLQAASSQSLLAKKQNWSSAILR